MKVFNIPLRHFYKAGVLFVFIFTKTASAYLSENSYGQVTTSKVFSEDSIVGTYEYADATFGPTLPSEDDAFRGILHKASPEDACVNLDPPPSNFVLPLNYGWVALIKRSKPSDLHRSCTFIEKTLYAQAVGYSGVIIFNYDPSETTPVRMDATNGTQIDLVHIPAVFVTYHSGLELGLQSFPDMEQNMTVVTFVPYEERMNPYKILIPLAFSFVGILLVTCIVMVVRWCQNIRRKRRSRISKSQLKKIPITKYKSTDQYDCCAICLDDYIEGDKLRLLPCQHTFHQKCVDPWLLKNKRTCPVCKRKVISRAARRRRRRSDSSDSSDSEAADSVTSERTPLLPSPAAAGRSAQSQPHRHYGSGLAQIPEDDALSDLEILGTSETSAVDGSAVVGSTSTSSSDAGSVEQEVTRHVPADYRRIIQEYDSPAGSLDAHSLHTINNDSIIMEISTPTPDPDLSTDHLTEPTEQLSITFHQPEHDNTQHTDAEIVG